MDGTDGGWQRLGTGLDARGRGGSLAALGAMAGALPFVIHVASASSMTADRIVVASTYRDWAAVSGGAVALACALAAIGVAVRARATPPRVTDSTGAAVSAAPIVMAGLLVAALGGYQLARGFGVFEPPARLPIAAPPAPVAPDAPPAASSCASGDACFDLGEKLGDSADGAAAFQRACDFGLASGCYNAGLAWNDARGVARDAARALALFQKACNLGDGNACANASVFYLDGDGVAKDVARGGALAAAGCDRDSGLACKNLAAIYQDGDGVGVDETRAVKLMMQACELDDSADVADACDAAGVALVKGRGVKADAVAAIAYFTRACDCAARYCFNLAVAYDRGLGGERDAGKARELYRRACDADDATACNNLGDLFNRGIGGGKDPAAAQQLFERACRGGAEIGCKNAKQMR